MPLSERGIITLGNDAVLDWLTALFESIRARAALAEIPVVVIPFDDDVDELAETAARYNVELFQGVDLALLDRIGYELCPGRNVQAQMFRKFAGLWGLWDQTLFLDSDVVVVDDLEDVFTAGGAADFVYFDHSVDDVFGTRDRHALGLGEGGELRGVIAGAWLVRRGAFSPSDIEAAVPMAKLAAEVVTVMNEQVVLNLMLEVSQRRIVSAGELGAGLSYSTWVGSPALSCGAGGTWWNAGQRVPFLHWAGTTLTPWMPHKAAFLGFRLRADSSAHARVRVEAKLALNAARRALARLRKLLKLSTLRRSCGPSRHPPAGP